MALRAVRPAAAWWTLLRAMGQTGGAALAASALTLAATKVLATALGPAAMALLATLQQLRNAALTAATLNGQTALVQGLSSTDGGRRREFLRTALVMMTASILLICGTLVVARKPLARLAGLEASRSDLVAWLAAPLLAAALFVILTALLTALGQVGRLAVVQLAGPAAMAVASYPVAARMLSARAAPPGLAAGAGESGEFWLLALVAGSAAASVGAAGWALWDFRSELLHWIGGPGPWFRANQVARFFAISGAFLLSGLVSTWMLVAIRAGILRGEGLLTGGQFDAAWAISMNHATLVLASLQTFYLPLLARTESVEERARHVGRVLLTGCAVAGVLLALLAVLKPWVIALLYSGEFSGAARYLRWTLVGDYLKISSWILSIPLVAGGDMRSFLAADLAAYASFLALALGLSRWMGPAEAAALGFVGMYGVHLTLCAARVWQRGEFRPDGRLLAGWAAGFGCVLVASGLNWNVS